MNNFYKMEEGGPLAEWGDYGHILISGTADHQNGFRTGQLQLFRTGPFVPPVSFPGVGNIVVTSHFRKILENSGLTGFSFKQVAKKHIVRLEWEKWDPRTENPPFFPVSGEPEDYIDEQPHDPQIAEQLGDLWEICVDEGIDVKREMDEIYLLSKTWNGNDIFFAKSTLKIYLSEKGKNWFERNASGWVCFTLEEKVI